MLQTGNLSGKISKSVLIKITLQKMLNSRHTSIRGVTWSCSEEEQRTNMSHLTRDHIAYYRLMIMVQSALR